MARSGRKPKPIEAHRRDGTRPDGHGSTPQPSVVAGRERPDMPEVLSLVEGAAAIWEIVLDDLEEGKVLDKSDWSVVERFCVELARARSAAATIAEEGLYAEGQKGAPIIHPARTLEERAGKNAASLAESLGLGPSGRARLGIAKRRNGERHGRSMNAGSSRVPESPRRQTPPPLTAVEGGKK